MREDRLLDRRFGRNAWICAAAIGAVVLAAACANSEDVGGDEGGIGSGDDSDSGVSTSSDEDASGVVSRIDSGSNNGGGGNDAGTMSTTDGGGSEGGTTGGGSCAATNTCPSGTALNMISGDSGNDTATATGFTSTWLTIYVTENNSSPIGQKLKMKATLTAAVGTSYNFELYRGSSGSMTPECTNVATQTSSPMTTQSLSQSWGEGTVSNGSDDSSMITIHIVNVSGPCDNAHAWQLSVEGDTT